MRGKLISLLSLALIFLAFFLPVDTGFPWPLAIIPVAATAGSLPRSSQKPRRLLFPGFLMPCRLFWKAFLLALSVALAGFRFDALDLGPEYPG